MRTEQANGVYAGMNTLEQLPNSEETDAVQAQADVTKQQELSKEQEREKILAARREQSRYREFINEDAGC